MEKERGIIIVGCSHDAELLARHIAAIETGNPKIEIITIDEAQKNGLDKRFELKAPIKIPELVALKTIFNDNRSNRNKRREAERKSKKPKR